VGGVVALTMGVGTLARDAAGATQFWGPSQQKFEESAKGVQRAVVWGDPATGDYAFLVKYEPGVERGWHTHSNPLHLVMISGTLVFEVEGSPPQELGPGSGVNEAPNVKHNSKCKGNEGCMFLITGSKYDFKPAREPVSSAAK